MGQGERFHTEQVDDVGLMVEESVDLRGAQGVVITDDYCLGPGRLGRMLAGLNNHVGSEGDVGGHIRLKDVADDDGKVPRGTGHGARDTHAGIGLARLGER